VLLKIINIKENNKSLSQPRKCPKEMGQINVIWYPVWDPGAEISY
jgi:hypothetical protein